MLWQRVRSAFNLYPQLMSRNMLDRLRTPPTVDKGHFKITRLTRMLSPQAESLVRHQPRRNGMDIRRVQLLLGHAGLNTMQVYLQFRDSVIREVYDAVMF